ncbi:MAG: COX15/CtaA family protein [Planctomycetota bacterium]
MPADAPPLESNSKDVVFPPYRRWLQVLAFLLVLGTFGLVAIGGTVTSYDEGMAVPGGFDTFGYWSLTAPLYVWWHDFGTWIEHSHRLKGYVVGWLTIGVLVGVLLTQRRRRWVKVLGWVLLVYVIAQGVLGILRVDQVSLFLAGVHGVTGQIFFALTVLMAAALGKRWMSREAEQRSSGQRVIGRLPWAMWVFIGLLLTQLALGSSIRHGQASLAIPDWPLHYGQLVPPMDQAGIDAAVAALPADVQSQQREAMLGEPVEAWRVHLHLTHRVGAYATLAFGVGFLFWAWRRWRDGAVRRIVLLVGGLLGVQVLLGVWTVLSGVYPPMATLHQTVGAVLLGASVWLGVRMKLVAITEGAAKRPLVDSRKLQLPRESSRGSGGAVAA